MNDQPIKMTFDDPRLTAFALGELVGAERSAVAAAVAADPTLAAEVNKIRAFSAQLRRSFADEPAPAVKPLRASARIAAPPGSSIPAKVVRGPFFHWKAAATAAAAAIAVMLWMYQTWGPGARANRWSPQMTIAQVLNQSSPESALLPPPFSWGGNSALPRGSGAGATSGGIPSSAGRRGGQAVNAIAPDLAYAMPPAPSAFGGGAGRRGGGGFAGAAGGAGVAGFVGRGGGRQAQSDPYQIVIVSSAPVTIAFESDAAWGYRYPTPGPDVVVNRRRPPEPAPYFATGEGYDHLLDNAFTDPAQTPFSTFALDVDTASYTNVRRFLDGGQLPPPDAVRIEELVNYFPYNYAGLTAAKPASQPPVAAPFWVNLGAAPAPWSPTHRLVRVALKARDVPAAERAAANFVFLLDVSGSMDMPNKLPLVKESLHQLLARLRPDDRVSIVTYANGSGVALPPTPVAQSDTILGAVDALNADGGTNGGAGIQLAYDVAKKYFNREGVNRIILCTDGDFNVGLTGEELLTMVAEEARSGVSLTVLGFGTGNLKDNMLEQLAGKGRGDYGYIDTRQEAQKLFVEQLAGTLVPVARDVKVQVEFNPSRVAAYRLLGYEDRLLGAQDFNNDRVGAGEMGAGRTFTALYEIVPAGADYGYPSAPGEDLLRYTENTPSPRTDSARATAGANSNELLTVKFRYKQPGADASQRLDFPFVDRGATFEEADGDFQFAAAVAGFGMLLRDSPYRGGTTMNDVLVWAARGAKDDPAGHREEFMDLVRRARDLRRDPVGTLAPGRVAAPGVDPLRY